jgi:hypothetical protein
VPQSYGKHEVFLIHRQVASSKPEIHPNVPAHYKELRAKDATAFLAVVAEARETITDLVDDYRAGGLLLLSFYRHLIFGASSEAIRLEKLSQNQTWRSSRFLERPAARCL